MALPINIEDLLNIQTIENATNTSEHMRTRYRMYIKPHEIFSAGWNFRDWEVLFYDVLHAFSRDKSDDGVISVSNNDREFCFVSDRQIYLNDNIALVQAVSESFSVIQNRGKTEVRFKPDKSIWPEMIINESALENIIKDYAYLHSNQTIIWKGQNYHYPEGLKDMLKKEFGITSDIIWIRKWDIEIAIARTDNGEQTVIDYVNTNRTNGEVHVNTLKKAIKTYLPEVAKKGYVAVFDINVLKNEILYESGYYNRVVQIPKDRENYIISAIKQYLGKV